MGATQSREENCILETPKGLLKGLEFFQKDGQRSIYKRFTHIPYALSPVGERRWRRPTPLPESFSFSHDDEAGDYTSFGAICPQPVYQHNQVQLENPDAAPPIPLVESEDCLYLNIWIPGGSPPSEGWPIQFFIHGGWLQVGNAMQSNSYDPFDLLQTTDTPRIIVAPTYRLNVFGFLTSKEQGQLGEDDKPGNYGLWDQRAALEWTYTNVHLFGGNPDNITVGGLSAGAYSALFQLFYDTLLPKQIIQRVFFWSNAVGVQPNHYDSTATTEQFTELLQHFKIPGSASADEKISLLRGVPAQDLVEAISTMTHHTFRACSDDSFIPSDFLGHIHNGMFASRLRDHKVSIMVGEVSDEALLYRLVNPPSSYEGLLMQLNNYYPSNVVESVLKMYNLPGGESPAKEWADIFGKIAADCQVHATVRGFAHCMLSKMSVDQVHRYRIKWRAKSLDAWLDPDVGVCHGADAPIWWCSGYRAGYSEEDKAKVQEFIRSFGRFLRGEAVGWGTRGERDIREFDRNGSISVVKDEDWERGLRVWEAMRKGHE
ncbi:MAG: hypothetical protein Q9160_007940 [Pyrenula sp. 1 TL-2023]